MAKWLIKSEPSECGIDDFAKAPATVIPWDGVRNYQARNFLSRMAEGDEVLLYHSSCPGCCHSMKSSRCPGWITCH